MKKNIITISIVILALIAISFAAPSLSIKVDNGVTISSSDIYLVNGTSYCESGRFSAALTAEDYWSSNNKEMVVNKVTKNRNYLLYFVRSGKAKAKQDSLPPISSEHFVQKAMPYVSKSGKVYLPVREVAETLGYQVSWDGKTKTIILKNSQVDEEIQGIDDVVSSSKQSEKFEVVKRNINIQLTAEDRKNFETILMWEAGYNGYANQLAVANVILNRVLHSGFKHTVTGVIFQRGQFPPAHRSDFYSKKPTESVKKAIADALNGHNNIDRCLYFNYKPFKGKEKDLYGEINNEYFYY